MCEALFEPCASRAQNWAEHHTHMAFDPQCHIPRANAPGSSMMNGARVAQCLLHLRRQDLHGVAYHHVGDIGSFGKCLQLCHVLAQLLQRVHVVGWDGVLCEQVHDGVPQKGDGCARNAAVRLARQHASAQVQRVLRAREVTSMNDRAGA